MGMGKQTEEENFIIQGQMQTREGGGICKCLRGGKDGKEQRKKGDPIKEYRGDRVACAMSVRKTVRDIDPNSRWLKNREERS